MEGFIKQAIVDEYEKAASFSNPDFSALKTRFRQLGISDDAIIEALGKERAARILRGPLPSDGCDHEHAHFVITRQPDECVSVNDVGDLRGSSVRRGRGTARILRHGRLNFEC